MSLIHIARNNVVLGQFPEAEVAEGLRSGLYFPTDLAWRAGMPQWKALSEWPELNASGEEPPAFASPEEYAPVIMPAWERRKEIGFFTALLDTTKQVLRSPDITFRNMPKVGGLGGPMLYYLIPNLLLGAILGVVMALFLGFFMSKTGSPGGASPFGHAMAGVGGVGVGVFYFLFFLIVAPIGILLMSGFTHLMLMAWGACKSPFEATFRVVAYSTGALTVVSLPAQPFSFIPCVGALISMALMALWVWVIIIQIKGLAIVHGSSQGRVTGAVLTPVFVCCCAAGGLWIAAFAGAIAKGHAP